MKGEMGDIQYTYHTVIYDRRKQTNRQHGMWTIDCFKMEYFGKSQEESKIMYCTLQANSVEDNIQVFHKNIQFEI